MGKNEFKGWLCNVAVNLLISFELAPLSPLFSAGLSKKNALL